MVVFTIRTDDAVTVVLLLEGASVELAELLKLLGGRLAFYSVRDYEVGCSAGRAAREWEGNCHQL